MAVFIWRINFVGLAIERKVDSSNTFSGSANIVAQERWSSLGRKILVHILLTTASLLLIDSGTYGISVCVQVARVYGDSFLVSFSLFALFSLFQFVFTLSLAKTSPMSQESIIDGVAKGTNVAFFTMFSVPLKLFRFMQVIRTPPYSFWPLLFVSQIMDKVIPRYLLVRHEQKMRRLATLSDTVSIHHGKKVIPDDSSDLSLPSTQFDTLGPRSCNTKVEPLRNGYSMVNVTNSLNDTPRIVLSSNISGSVETEGLTAGNQDVSSPLSGDFTESASQPRADIDVYASQIVEEASNSTTIALASNALNSTGAGNLCRSHSVIAKSVGITAVVNTLESAERKVWSTMPYDYTRRDYAISDYIALFVSLGLILASPSDFLVKPNASGASGFYEDGINLNLENSALVSASHSDLFKAVGRRGWRVISLTAISSVIFSFALEWALVVWEYFLGSPLYNHVYELSVRSIMTTLLSIASIVFWIMAGSRGLFAYGPLNLEYGT
ncbi:hypothetical protein BC829DRAFT_87207 [Chytridium lagenaria]|nr:hypothetical protein BC829DRAFT_87207 [Chytridium lagenaria]